MNVIYTDGSALRSEGVAGIAFLLIGDSTNHEIFSLAFHETSSARAELLAAIMAISVCDCKRITLYSDSSYVVQGINRWLSNWVKRGYRRSNNKIVANSDLWRNIYGLLITKNVSAIKVRAHQGNPFNEIVDSAARSAAKDFASQTNAQSSRS